MGFKFQMLQTEESAKYVTNASISCCGCSFEAGDFAAPYGKEGEGKYVGSVLHLIVCYFICSNLNFLNYDFSNNAETKQAYKWIKQY